MFSFNEEVRKKYRNDFGLDGKFVIGFVGRLSKEKNLFRALDIFRAVLSKNKNAYFLIVGDGVLKRELEQYAKNILVNDSVIFFGKRDDVSAVYMCFDVFIMTSLFEGLPVVEVEAQASGLSCVISEKVPAIDLIDRISIVSLEKADEEWSEVILKDEFFDRNTASTLITKNGYDIRNEAKKLQNFYLGL
ncbi:MAG: glycosyltransferase [Lachnospiraceae bacterium]|nr:glycosyltransferase [Lachnospiraceae bacterium]